MNMIEMDGNEVSEVMIEQAFRLGQKAIDELCTIQEEFLMKVFVPMSQFHYTSKLAQFVKYNYPPDELKAQVAQIITHERLESLYGKSKSEWEIIFS